MAERGWPSAGETHLRVLCTDACPKGWGAVLEEGGVRVAEAGGGFTPQEGRENIALLEGEAVVRALKALPIGGGGHLYLRVDNEVLRWALVEGGSRRSLPLTSVVREVWEWCLERGVELKVGRVVSAENPADPISREEDQEDWMLDREIFAVLDRLWGPHSVDRFASRMNRQVQRYNGKRWDVECEAVGALEQEWRGENNWCNPPFSLFPSIVRKLEAIRWDVELSMVVPRWEGQWWFHRLMAMASEMLPLPRDANLFRPRSSGNQWGRGPPRWDSVVLRFRRRP